MHTAVSIPTSRTLTGPVTLLPGDRPGWSGVRRWVAVPTEICRDPNEPGWHPQVAIEQCRYDRCGGKDAASVDHDASGRLIGELRCDKYVILPIAAGPVSSRDHLYGPTVPS